LEVLVLVELVWYLLSQAHKFNTQAVVEAVVAMVKHLQQLVLVG